MRLWPVVLALVVGLALGAGAVALLQGSQLDEHGGGSSRTSVNFTASGDISSSPQTSDVLAQIASSDPDLHVALGDLSYGVTGEEQEWCRFVIDHVGQGFPFQLLAGNHEGDGQNGNINDFAACLPNQLPGLVGTYGRQWYVDVPAQEPLVRLIAVSPGISFPEGSIRYEAGAEGHVWTASAIDGARQEGIPWVVAAMHKPCLSIGDYGCEISPDLLDLLLEKGVDLVLNAHEHAYMRTHQLARSPGCTQLEPEAFEQECVADDDSEFTKGRGTVVATVGTGGGELRDVYPSVDSEAGYFASASGANLSPTWGNLHVSLTRTLLDARFEGAAGADFGDDFTITADGTPER